MNEHIKAADANRNFSQILRRVGQGERFVITSHGRPVAEIKPLVKDAQDRDHARNRLLARLRSQPVLDVGMWRREELYED